MKHTWLYIIILLLAVTVGVVLFTNKDQEIPEPAIVDTVPPAAAPEQTVQPAQKDDTILLTSPLPAATIAAPLTVTGKARGSWYFEGTFPIILTDWDGKIIGEGQAKAQTNWMTSDYVPFVGTIEYTKPDTTVSNRGTLILKKDNPSGDPKNDDALEIEVRY